MQTIDHRRISRFVHPSHRRCIGDILFILSTPQNDKLTRYRSFSAISCSDNKSLQRYMVPAIYPATTYASCSVRNIIAIYHLSEISLQRFIVELGLSYCDMAFYRYFVS